MSNPERRRGIGCALAALIGSVASAACVPPRGGDAGASLGTQSVAIVEPPSRPPLLDAGSALLRGLRPPMPRPVTPGAHVILLTRDDLDNSIPLSLSSIAAGELPGTAFPAGTVYLARSEEGALYVAEWDLARAAVRRKVRLDLADSGASVRIWHIGNALHLLIWDRALRIRYVRLTSDLRQTSSEDLGQAGDGSEPGPIVGNAAWTWLFFEGIPANTDTADAKGYYAMSFDAAGKRMAARMLSVQEPFRARDVALVIDGNAFVALNTPRQATDEKGIDIIRLTPALQIEKHYLDLSPRGPMDRAAPFAGLFPWGDQFYAAWFDVLSVKTFSTSVVPGETTSCDSPRSPVDTDVDLWLYGEHVTFREDNVDDWIEWTDRDPSPLPPPPCVGLQRGP
jgi:hypothetical protein